MVQIIRAFQLIQAEQEAISLSVEQQLQLQQQEEQPERRASPAEISTKASSIFAIHRQDGPCSEHSSDQQNSDSDEDDQMETDTKDTLSPHQSSPSDPHPHPSPSYIINQPSDMDSHTPHHHPHELSASLPELTPLNQPSSPVSSKMSNTVTFHTPSSMAPSQYNRRHQHDHQLATKRTQILSNKLQQIFQLPPDEKLLAEYPSWLFRSVLLKGYVYLTTGHVCFYAFLRSNEREVDEDRPTIKAGMLTRRHSGKLNQRQTLKSWFILQDTILSWYSSSHEPFFPIGQIDLHFCTKVEPATPESKTPNQFKLYVSGKVYTFISDTLQSKDEWVKVIQEAVFACQHNGQNVKIAIPLSSIESIEKCDSIQFAQTVCIKTKENATAVPFAQKKQNSPLVPPEEIGDDSLVDYFFGFLQDCQTPYELLKAALERAQAPSSSSDPPPTSQSLTSSSVPSTSIPQILSPIRDSTRFRITSNPVAKHGEDYFANPIIGSPSRSGSQTPISTDTPNLNTEERKTSFKFTDKITRIASTSNKFVGSPIRPAFNTVKNVPVTLNPIKPAKDVINSARGLISSSPQDPSSPLAPKKEIPSRSPSTEKISDEEGPSRLHQEAQLTPRDQKARSDIIEDECNLIRSGSSMYGQLYLASPIPSNSLKQKNFRKSCVCFKGQKWISSAPIKMILPVEALTAVRSEGLKLCLTTHQTDVLVSQEDVWFEFATLDQLKAVNEEINRMIEKNKSNDEDESSVDEEAKTKKKKKKKKKKEHPYRSSKSKLHITCLTIGSRGDVQPYIALCQKLQLDGHTCRIASHGEYRKWVEGYGIEYVEIGGDPAELMKICVDNGMFTLGFLKEAFSKFRGWLDELLVSSLDACQGTDLLIESPSTMAGIHIAEALQIPYFRAFTMPWTRTKEYPHAYTVFDQVFWKAMSGQVNKWRKEKLGLRSTTYEKLEVHKVPFLYNFSPSIVPAPLDWYEWIHVTVIGLSTNMILISSSPLQKLLAFLDRAHSQNKKVVYIGFGSVTTTKVIIESVKSAGVYAIISKGWSERLSKEEIEQQEDRSMIYQINSIPHDWLFPRIDAVCHHGGAGTTGASLKAGIPTIIKPFFGDQFFGLNELKLLVLARVYVNLLLRIFRTLWNEDGAAKAVECIYRDLDYARSLIKRKHNKATEPAASVVPPTAAPLDPSSKPRMSLPGRAADLTTDQERRTDGRAGPKENDSQEEEEEGVEEPMTRVCSSLSDDDDLQTDQSGSSDELLLFEMRNPSTLARSSTPPIPESGPSHTLVGQKSNTTIGPSSQQIDNQNIDNSIISFFLRTRTMSLRIVYGH
ncbi:hypothetical protein H4Q26_001401 [Puccinia striiformis f. sp. tritici PST-130]|nr:hypothetical protein H4Q26_001401 [Puccinia striiformis f. sp. tritici PST-130]